MDVEKETRIEYHVITGIILILATISIILIVGISTKVIEFKADSDSLELMESSASSHNLQLIIKNSHSSDLQIKNILVDGTKCDICTDGPTLFRNQEKTITCANIEHKGYSYSHDISLTYSDTKESYEQSARFTPSGSVSADVFTTDSLKPIFERVYKTPLNNEVIKATYANNCPQILISGTKANSNSFDLFLYSFNDESQLLISRPWDLHEFDSGNSVAVSSRGLTYIFGDTYQQTQGSDTVLLTTDGYKTAYTERILGTSASEIAKDVFLDRDDYVYTVTQIQGSKSKILLTKSDINTEIIWNKEIQLQKLSTYLTGAIQDNAVYVLNSDDSGLNTVLHKYDFEGTETLTKTIPAIISDVTFDSEGNIILVGETKASASTDAHIRKYDARMNLLWSQNWGDSANEKFATVVVAPDDTIYTAGHFRIANNLFRSVILKYSPSGALTESYLLRASNSLKITDLELTQTALFAIGELESDNQQDVYIARFE